MMYLLGTQIEDIRSSKKTMLKAAVVTSESTVLERIVSTKFLRRFNSFNINLKSNLMVN